MYLNTLAKFGFTSTINDFTRVTETSKSCIDHIFINNYLKLSDHSNTSSSSLSAYILKHSITDHFSTFITCNVLNNKIAFNDFQIFEYQNINFDLLNTLILNTNWNLLLEHEYVDTVVEKFNSLVNNFIESSIYKTVNYKI